MHGRSFVLLVLLLFLGVAACQQQAPLEQAIPEPETAPLEGAWRFVGGQTVAASGETTEVTIHESLMLFTAGHYSIARSAGEEPIPPYAERWSPTDTEKVARMNSIVVNAGTYEATESSLVTRPLFALVCPPTNDQSSSTRTRSNPIRDDPRFKDLLRRMNLEL